MVSLKMLPRFNVADDDVIAGVSSLAALLYGNFSASIPIPSLT